MLKRAKVVLVRNGNWQRYSCEMKNLQDRLFSSKHDIQPNRKSLQNDQDNKISLNKNKGITNQKTLSFSVHKEKFNNPHDALLQTEMIIGEIRHYLKHLRLEEGKWRKDKKKKDLMIKEFVLQKKQMKREISDYKHLAAIHEKRTQFYKNALQRKNGKGNKKVRHQLNREARSLEPGASYPVTQKGPDKKQSIELIERKINQLTDLKKKDYLRIQKLGSDYQVFHENWAVKGIIMPIHHEMDMNNIKRGSWLELAWNWLNGDKQTQYLEKTAELQSTINELKATVSSYEEVLEKLSKQFDQYEKNEELYLQEMVDLKENLQAIAGSEDEYLYEIQQLKDEIQEYKQKNISLEKKISELDLLKEELDAKSQQLKEYENMNNQSSLPPQKMQKKEKISKKMKQQNANAQRSQRTEMRQFEQKQSSIRRSRTSNANGMQRNMNNQPRQMNPSQQRAQNKLDLIQKFYPQARSQSSVFNPFKY
ncbi:hypothetical protein DFO70_10937 [Cytobacillus firmus]|uniref:Uncharacterized protein n=2 Tax=Cytobacillus TaxID=2675230 RepID=A0A366JQI3_CYTFI|nr:MULTISPECIES: hypothetical protein [Cytobacillus]RBP90532.1 hypothetical protein DFO70_10937 [Cytobacillus firmus]TDX46114.1 hypothetical protein DFO72_102594 [Cytobacillus oceanisediminis]